MWSLAQNKRHDGSRMPLTTSQEKFWLNTFGTRTEMVFLDFKRSLQPFEISKFYAAQWGAYERQINPKQYVAGKEKIWRIEGG